MDWKGDNAEGLTFEPLNLTFEHSPLIQLFLDANMGQVEGLKRMGVHYCISCVHRWTRKIASK